MASPDWNTRIAAQAGSDIEPLRKRLLGLELNQDAIQFLAASSPQQIKDGLIKRIEWLSGAKDLVSLRQALSNRLIYLGEKKNVASSLCDNMVDPLISKVLSLASSKGSRRIERADFIRFFDEASKVSLPISAVETMMSALNPVSSSSSHGFVSTIAVLRPVASIDPNKFAARTTLVETAQRAIDEQSFAWLYGATGTGKSSLSKLIAREAGAGWYSLQLRSFDARETAEALYRASSQIAIEKPGGVVLDDLGSLTSSLPKDAFLNLIETARRRSTPILVTSNSNHQTLSSPRSAQIQIPQSRSAISQSKRLQPLFLQRAETLIIGRATFISRPVGPAPVGRCHGPWFAEPELVHSGVAGTQCHSRQ